MTAAEQLQVLQAAQGDPAKLALATVDLAFPDRTEAARAVLKEALTAAAMPHWVDASVLAALLTITPAEAATLLTDLRQLRIIEAFPARGESAVNVHETARLALRQALARTDLSRFRHLSQLATDFFTAELTSAGRIEWVYHFLLADPERGADALAKLVREWVGNIRPDDQYALATAVSELEQTELVQDAARVEVLLCMAWARWTHGEAGQLEPMVREALALAKTTERFAAVVQANWLLGETQHIQGKLSQAMEAYGQALQISQALVEQEPSNVRWQRDLATAHSRVGVVLEAQGNLAEAQQAYGEDLRISRVFAEQDGSNTGWQRDLAVAHCKVGDVLRAQGKLAEAQVAYGENLRISRELAEQDGGNAGWQRDLATAYSKVGDVLQAQGKLAEAQQAYGECLRISRVLVEQDGSNAGWQYDLAKTHGNLAVMYAKQGKLPAARKETELAVIILRRLVLLDPSNANWRKNLVVTLNNLAEFQQATHNRSAAKALRAEAKKLQG